MAYVVRRSIFYTTVLFVVLCALVAAGIYALGIFQPPARPGQRGLGVLALAFGGIGLFLLWLRTRRPAEELVIDANGLHWWKAPRTIGWAELAEVRLDAGKSSVYIYLKLAPHAHIGDMDIPHPIELLGNALTGSDLTIMLSGTDCRLGELDEAMLRFMPPEVTLHSPLA